jgi:hypothetical protein
VFNAKKINLTIVSIAITIGMAIGFYTGYLGRETKQPGEAIRTSDATGRWKRHAETAVDIDAEVVTNTRIRLVMQAIPTSALLNAGILPTALTKLVEEGLIGQEIIRDGWSRPFVYEVDPTTGTYAVRSLGADGVESDDDIPKP